MEQNDVAEDDWKAAVNEDRLDGVKEEERELSELHLGQVLLPPEILLHLRTQSCQEVVEVHHSVDSHVQETAESCVTPSNKFNSPPSSERHDSMVNYMKCGEVAVFLPQNEEE